MNPQIRLDRAGHRTAPASADWPTMARKSDYPPEIPAADRSRRTAAARCTRTVASAISSASDISPSDLSANIRVTTSCCLGVSTSAATSSTCSTSRSAFQFG